jgi:hypothetical protein
MTTLHLKKSMCRSPLWLGLLLIPLGLLCFGLTPTAKAVNPPPDGGYPNGNTAEGDDALFSLTDGTFNTANGYQALYSNTSGFDNTATGRSALFTTTSGGANTATGVSTLYSNTAGFANTANGVNALFANTTGNYNTAMGHFAMFWSETGHDNTALGVGAMEFNNSGTFNTAVGNYALYGIFTGRSNIALGYTAGIKLSTGNNNIYIGNKGGTASESGRVRIGTVGTHEATFVAGISGASVSNGAQVMVGPNGKLGTILSSARFKEAIKPMDKASEAVHQLQPVTFRYKEDIDPNGIPQFGLIAEQVEKVNPDLVVRGDDGKIMTVRYEAVNAMLLNEFLKEHRNVAEQQSTIAELKTTVAQQQKQIEALTATVQKVSDQIMLRKPAPQLVANL